MPAQRERQRHYEETRDPLALRERLIAAGVPVEDAWIDIADFEEWRRDFWELDRLQWVVCGAYRKVPGTLSGLQVTWRLTKVFIHTEADSIWAELLSRPGIVAYRLDLNYPPGIKGHDISADAGESCCLDLPARCCYSVLSRPFVTMPILSASSMRLGECSMNVDAGQYLYYYMDEAYFILSSSYVDLSGIHMDQGAICVWREDEHKGSF